MLDVLWMSVTKKEQLINCSIQLAQSSLDCTFARSFFCWFFSAIKRASNWRFPYFFVVVRTIASPCLCFLFSQSAIHATCDSVRLCLSLSLNHCRCDALGELFVELLIVRLHFGESKYVGFKMKGSRKQAVEESQKRRARQWQISRMDPNIQWHANELDIYRKCLLAGGLLLRKDIQY